MARGIANLCPTLPKTVKAQSAGSLIAEIPDQLVQQPGLFRVSNLLLPAQSQRRRKDVHPRPVDQLHFLRHASRDSHRMGQRRRDELVRDGDDSIEALAIREADVVLDLVWCKRILTGLHFDERSPLLPATHHSNETVWPENAVALFTGKRRLRERQGASCWCPEWMQERTTEARNDRHDGEDS